MTETVRVYKLRMNKDKLIQINDQRQKEKQTILNECVCQATSRPFAAACRSWARQMCSESVWRFFHHPEKFARFGIPVVAVGAVVASGHRGNGWCILIYDDFTSYKPPLSSFWRRFSWHRNEIPRVPRVFQGPQGPQGPELQLECRRKANSPLLPGWNPDGVHME